MTDTASSKLLTIKAKESVYNVYEHFRNKGKGFLERTAEATGSDAPRSLRSAGRKHKLENCSHQHGRSAKTTRAWTTLTTASSETKSTNFTVRKQLPTLKGIDVKVTFNKCIM